MQARAARSQAEVRSPMRADAPHPIGMCTTMPGSHVTPMLAHNPPPTPISNPFDTLPIAGPCKTCSAPRSTATDHMVGMAAHAGGSNPFHLPSPLGTNTWFLSNIAFSQMPLAMGNQLGECPRCCCQMVSACTAPVCRLCHGHALSKPTASPNHESLPAQTPPKTIARAIQSVPLHFIG